MDKKKIAIIGTQGIPNQYGGFETLVEFLAEYLSNQFEITIFCSSKYFKDKIEFYKGCNLVYVPLNANGVQSIPYDIISILKSYKTFDKILILGSSGGIILPFLHKYKDKFVLNFGGLDWKRSKWNYLTQKFLKLSEYFAVKNSAKLIADNIGIQEYIKNTYGRSSTLIEYGGNQVNMELINESDLLKHPFLNRPYAFSVARIQSDNNIDLIIEAFLDKPLLPLVLVGNWNNSNYGKDLQQKFSENPNVYLLNAIYDSCQLNKLRSNCKVYVHGHSAGGTNPSLVEAMNLGLPIIAYASGFNEYTTENKAIYFKSKIGLNGIIKMINKYDLNNIGNQMKKIALKKYQWNIIAEKYNFFLKG